MTSIVWFYEIASIDGGRLRTSRRCICRACCIWINEAAQCAGRRFGSVRGLRGGIRRRCIRVHKGAKVTRFATKLARDCDIGVGRGTNIGHGNVAIARCSNLRPVGIDRQTDIASRRLTRPGRTLVRFCSPATAAILGPSGSRVTLMLRRFCQGDVSTALYGMLGHSTLRIPRFQDGTALTEDSDTAANSNTD